MSGYGIWVNANSITLKNGTTPYSVVANKATYVGSVYMTGNAQTAMQFQPAAVNGGSHNVLGLYNAYNRVTTTSSERDLTTNWTYAGSSWIPINNNSNNKITFLDGLQQSQISSNCQVYVATGYAASTGANLDSTTAMPDVLATAGGGAIASTISAVTVFPPQIGVHTLYAMQNAFGFTATFSAGSNSQALIISLGI